MFLSHYATFLITCCSQDSRLCSVYIVYGAKDFENSTVRSSAIFKSNNAEDSYKAILFVIRQALLQDDNISIKYYDYAY